MTTDLAEATRAIERRRRVQAGMDLLDERREDDWRRRIDLAALSMGDTDWCVLGQLYEPDSYHSGYQAGLFTLWLDNPEDFGFEVDVFESYAELTEAWRLALAS